MNGTGQTTPPSKIVQIAGGDDPLALCEDGSVWALNWNNRNWLPVAPAHVATRQQASAATDEKQPALEWYEARIHPAPDMVYARFQGMSLEVLVCGEGGYVQAARKLGDLWISHGGGVVLGVTHWAYMPEGPKVKP